MSKKMKYKLKFNDSHMSELSIDIQQPMVPFGEGVQAIGMLAPNPIPIVEEISIPEQPMVVDTAGESEKVEERYKLELSTKLQNIINHVAEELYILLEKARDEGDRKQELCIAGAIDGVYAFLPTVNNGDLVGLDQSILSILQIANDHNVDIPKNLCYESIFECDEDGNKTLVALNDGANLDNATGKIEFKISDKLEDLTYEKFFTLRNAMIRDVRGFASKVKKADENKEVANVISGLNSMISELEKFLTDDLVNKHGLSGLKSELGRIKKMVPGKDYNPIIMSKAILEAFEIIAHST